MAKEAGERTTGGTCECPALVTLHLRPCPLRAGSRALQDAGIPYSSVQQAVVGYVYGESTSGQRAVYQLGLTGIPIYNVRGGEGWGSVRGREGWWGQDCV